MTVNLISETLLEKCFSFSFNEGCCKVPYAFFDTLLFHKFQYSIYIRSCSQNNNYNMNDTDISIIILFGFLGMA